MLGLDHLTVLVEVVQERVVALGEDGAADGRQSSEDVTGRRVVLAALEAGTELTGGHQEVDVVGSDEILRETDDGGNQGSLTVVVRGVLGDVTAELGHLDVRLELALEAREEHLALRGLEAVHDAGNGAQEICAGEEDKLLVDEIVVLDVVRGHVEEGAGLVVREPLLAILDALLAERHVDEVPVTVCGPREGLAVVIQGGEILLRLLSGGSTETLVVLDGPSAMAAVHGLLPVFVLGQGVENIRLLPLGRLDDGGDELDRKPGIFNSEGK